MLMLCPPLPILPSSDQLELVTTVARQHHVFIYISLYLSSACASTIISLYRPDSVTIKNSTKSTESVKETQAEIIKKMQQEIIDFSVIEEEVVRSLQT